LFAQVHVRQIGTVTIDVYFKLVTGLVMVDRQRLAHHYSSRVLDFDPYLTDVSLAKEPLQAAEKTIHVISHWLLRHLVPDLDTEKSIAVLKQMSTRK
jgi:hypothetical protein